MPDNDTNPRSFNHFFATLDSEQAHATASDELHLLTKAVRDEAMARHGRVSGKLSISIDIACDEVGLVEVTYDVKRKDPKRRTSKSVLWIDKKGHLVRNDPRQQSLPLREVSAQGQALREMTGSDRVKEV